MKVLHVNDHFSDRGGAEQYLLEVGALLEQAGHRNAVAYFHRDDRTLAQSPWPACHIGDASDGVVASRLREFIERERPDVALIHHVAGPALVETVAGSLPALAYVHGFAAVCPGLGKYYRRGDQVCERAFGCGCVPMHYLRRCSAARHPLTLARLMRKTARLKAAYLRVPRHIVATPYMRDLLVRNGFDAARIAILPPYFIRPDETPPYAPPARPNTLLYVGRLELEKGFPYLLAALSLLPEKVDLLVAGDGTQRAAYEQLAAQLGLAARVTFLGWLGAEEVAQRYRDAAITVMPSICPEAFGRAGVESFAQGRPVVAFRVGGIPDWLQDEVTGLLAEPADAVDLAAKISRLLVSTEHQQSAGQAGQREVAERYAAAVHLSSVVTLLGAVGHE